MTKPKPAFAAPDGRLSDFRGALAEPFLGLRDRSHLLDNTLAVSSPAQPEQHMEQNKAVFKQLSAERGRNVKRVFHTPEMERRQTEVDRFEEREVHGGNLRRSEIDPLERFERRTALIAGN